MKGHVAWFDTLSGSGPGISYSTDKLCLCLGCQAALKGAAPSAPSPGLVPISADPTLCWLSPRIKNLPVPIPSDPNTSWD